MKNFKHIFLLSFASTMVGIVISCKENTANQPADTLVSGVAMISADESFAPIVDQQIVVFESAHNEASIVPLYRDEVEAINLLLKDSVRLAVVTRELTPAETAGMEGKKLFPKATKIATDAIALVINKENKDSLIAVHQLRKILTGEITQWKQLNPQSDMAAIIFVFDHPNSGMLRYLQDSVALGTPISGNLFARNTSAEVLEYVRQTPEAMGVVGVSWVSDLTDTTGLAFDPSIRVMAVSGQQEATPYNSYQPYQAYIAIGDYPLSRNVYAILSDPRYGLPTGFSSFLSSDKGQRIMLRARLVPATQNIRLINVRESL